VSRLYWPVPSAVFEPMDTPACAEGSNTRISVTDVAGSQRLSRFIREPCSVKTPLRSRRPVTEYLTGPHFALNMIAEAVTTPALSMCPSISFAPGLAPSRTIAERGETYVTTNLLLHTSSRVCDPLWS